MAASSSSNSGKQKNVVVEEYNINIDDYRETQKREVIDLNKEPPGADAEREIEKVRELLQFNDEAQLDFVLGVGLIKDNKLGMPYKAQLTNDKWNLFLRPRFQDNLFGFVKGTEDVDIRTGIQVNVYDKGGHEFEMMLKRWVKDGRDVFFVLNRGWFSFCSQLRLGEDDFIAIRAFRHAITNMLCFIVTYKKMR